jgi:hypothetical protein
MSVVARTISSPYRNENDSATESDNMECYNDVQAGPSSSLKDFANAEIPRAGCRDFVSP